MKIHLPTILRKTNHRENLKSFIDNIYWGNDLGIFDRKKSLSESVCEIIYDSGQHMMNALVIDKSGYFLTCEHIGNKYRKGRLQYLGHDYEIKKIASNDALDLFLGKINTDLDPKATKCSFALRAKDEKRSRIHLVNCRDGKINVKNGYGFIQGTSEIRTETLSTGNYNCIPGDSGGIIVDDNFMIAGVNKGVFGKNNVDVFIGIGSVLNFLSNV